MRAFLKFCLQACRQGLRSVSTFCLWTLWLALALLAAFQLYIASVHELELPPHLLRALEQRFAAAGVHATFGRTRFDPAGHILVEDVRATIPSFPEPIATARALSFRLDPWALLAGRLEELELNATGVTLFIPAMFSASGRVEEVVRELDATFLPHDRQLTITHLTCQVGALPISVHGTIQLPAARTGQPTPPIAQLLAKNYAALSRRLGAAVAQLSIFEEPRLDLELSPSQTRGSTARVVFTTRALTWPSPAIHTGPLAISATLPLSGEAPATIHATLAIDELTAPAGASATHLLATVHGTLKPDTFAFDLRDIELTAAEINAAGATLDASALRLTPGPLPRLRADLVTRFAGLPLYLGADADLDAKVAQLSLAGRVDDGLLRLISARIGHDVRQWIDFPEPVTITTARATFAAGWKWAAFNARLAVPVINAYHVQLTDGRVALELTPTRLYAPEAFARVGEYFARGTYDHDPATNQYRFLLAGELRPLAISGWFSDWWPDFFKKLVFPGTAPAASVEVAGRWGHGTAGESRVIVAAETAQAEIFGAKFDHARARLFIRPHYLDAFDFSGTRGTGEAHGSFTRHTDPVTQALQTLDVDVASTLDPTGPAAMFGAAGAELIEPFAFDRPPSLAIRGHFDGPASPGGAHQRVDVAAQSDGAFRFHDFPFDRASLNVLLRDDTLSLESVQAGFAGGTARGRTQVTGRGDARRLGFDYALNDASLGRVIATIENYAALRKKTPPPPPNRFLKEKSNVRLDLSASAEGAYDDALSYHGEGTAALSGAELGEVKLLGLLSDLFSFTALRFNAARASFRIDGPRLVFSDVNLTGANSAINAHGVYALDRRELDFNAKLFPFQESDLGFKSIVGAFLTPFSNVFEVKLTGSLEQPSWRFVIGPTSFLRNLSQSAPEPTTPTPVPLSPLKR